MAASLVALVGSMLVPTVQHDTSGLFAPVQDRAWSPDGAKGEFSKIHAALIEGVDWFLGQGRAPAPKRPWLEGQAHSSNIRTASERTGPGGVHLALAPSAASSTGGGLIPFETFETYGLTTDTTARVDIGTGNLMLSSEDGALSPVGVALDNDRVFNSTQPYGGSLGGHWNSDLSGYDVGLQIGSTTSHFLDKSGASEKFTWDGTQWQHPASFDATLVTGSSSSTLVMNATGEKYTFNGSGWITSDVNSNGLGNTYTYDAAGDTTSITNAAGQSYTISWTTIAGNPYVTSVTDSAGRVTTYVHDASGRLIEADSPGSYWEKYTYNPSGLVSEITGVGPNSSTQVLVDFSYDSSGRILSISQGSVGASAYARTTTFSGWGASTTMTETDGDGNVTQWAENSYNIPKGVTDALGHASSWTHDGNGDVITYTNANGATTNLGYNSNYSLTSSNEPTGATATMSYGSTTGCSGTGGTAYDVHCSTNANGQTTAFSYDANGNATSTTTTPGTGSAVSTSSTYATATGGCYTTTSGGTTTVHGLVGELCSTTNGNGGTTSYKYDTSGNVTQVVPPAPLGSTSYTYDSLGRVTSKTDGNGKTTSYTYNVRDQLLTTTYNSGASVTETWTPNGLEATDSQDANNKTLYTYDALGNTLTQQNVTAGSTFTENYSYDAAGNLTSYSDQYGTVTYVYDSGNELTQLIEPSGSCTATGAPADNSGCIKFSYDVNGLEILRQFPNGAQVATTRDKTERVTRITAKDATGNVVFDKAYSYSLAGTDTMDVQTATSYVETGVPATAITTYGYDGLDRLTSAVEKTAAGATNASWAYTYDGDGNRTKQVLAGNVGTATGALSPGTSTYSYNAADELTSSSADSTTWSYDSAGELTKNGVTGVSLSYNDHSGTTGIGSASYTTYGSGNSNTRGRTDSGVTTSYATSTSLGLMGEDFANQRIYDVTPDGTSVGSRLGGGSRYYFIQDDLGSVVGLFDKDGGYYGGYTYGPYGEARFTSSNAALSNNHLRYLSAYWDTSANAYRMGARYYDPSLGRFTQVDPSAHEANNFAYASDNPVSNADPSGLWTLPAWARSTLKKILSVVEGILVTVIVSMMCAAANIPGCILASASVSLIATMTFALLNALVDGDSWSKAVSIGVSAMRNSVLDTLLNVIQGKVGSFILRRFKL